MAGWTLPSGTEGASRGWNSASLQLKAVALQKSVLSPTGLSRFTCLVGCMLALAPSMPRYCTMGVDSLHLGNVFFFPMDIG